VVLSSRARLFCSSEVTPTPDDEYPGFGPHSPLYVHVGAAAGTTASARKSQTSRQQQLPEVAQNPIHEARETSTGVQCRDLLHSDTKWSNQRVCVCGCDRPTVVATNPHCSGMLFITLRQRLNSVKDRLYPPPVTKLLARCDGASREM
jgi:hypothetical protein